MERVKTEKSQYARSLIEASLDPLFTISLKGKITDLNKASTDIIGNTREKIIGTDFFGYFTDPLQAREVYKDVYRNGFVTDFPLTIKDGKQTDVFFNGSVYKDNRGKVIGAVVVARDITEQKRISTRLTESIAFAETAAEIADQAKIKAEKATQIAESAVKANQQFLSNMSHEVRTPMNAIIGFTKVLLKTNLTAKQKEYLSAIKTSGDTLIVIINDILDLAKCKLVGMNDYLAKPVDERLLHSKIASLLKKPVLVKSVTAPENLVAEGNKSSCINLDDLIKRTKSNPVVVMEMIKAYLDQTPPLIIALNKSYNDQDWEKLYSVVHKMIPSFSIMGISKEFENMAKEVQEDARSGQHSNKISGQVLQLSSVCTQACADLKAEYERIEKSGL